MPYELRMNQNYMKRVLRVKPPQEESYLTVYLNEKKKQQFELLTQLEFGMS